MLGFGKKPPIEKSDEDPAIAERLEAGVTEPFRAIVRRLTPTDYNGSVISGLIPEDKFHGLKSLSELRDATRSVCGGGKYHVRLYEDKTGGAGITSIRLEIPGDPLVDGRPIAPKESKPKKDPEEPDEVEEMKKKLLVEKVDLELKMAQADKRKKLREVEDDFDGPVPSLPTPLDPAAIIEAAQAPLREELARFRAEQAAKAGEDAHREELRRIEENHRDEMRKLEALAAEKNGGGGMIEFFKMMNDQNKIAAEQIAAQNKATNDLVFKMLAQQNDSKENNAQIQFQAFVKAYEAGNAMGQGRPSEPEEEPPKDLAGVVNANIGKAIEAFSQYMLARNERPENKNRPPTQEEIKAITSQVIRDLRAEGAARREQAQSQLARREQAPPPPANPPERGKTVPVDRRMNRLLRGMLKDARAGVASQEKFIADAQRELPPEVCLELVGAFGTGGPEAIKAVLLKYGDSKLVEEVFEAVMSQSPGNEAPAAGETVEESEAQPQ